MATSVTLDPLASALATIRAHFGTEIPALVWKRGIQELGISQSGSGIEGSLIALTRDWEELAPVKVETVGGTTHLFKVAQLRIMAQLDLWAPYRVGLDLLGPQLDEVWHNRLPWKGGLELASAHYYDRPLTISKSGGGVDARDPDDVAQGSWHKTYTLEILSDLVVKATVPIASLITFELSTQLGPDTFTEPDFLIS